MTERHANFSPPVVLTQDHDGSSFDSGEASLDDWLRQRAWPNLLLAATRTYVVCPAGSHKIIGYYALSMGQILASETTGAIGRNMPGQIPVVLLGRLAIDRAWQGCGLGRALLADAIARAMRAGQEVSTRLALVHALSPQAESFYLRHGFTRLPTETPTLAFDLVKFKKLDAPRTA